MTRLFNPADPEPATRRFSEILAYHQDHPDASDDDYSDWLGELTKRICPECREVTMTRYEGFNGACEGCKPTEGM